MERVTTLGSTNNMNGWLRASSRRVAAGQREVATGQRFDRASNAPADAADVLRNQRSLGRLQQLDRNVTDARLWLDTSDTTITDVVSSLTRARTLTVQGANDVNAPEARAAIAADVRNLSQELLSLANTTVNGRPMFGGTSGSPVAYDPSGTFVGNNGGIVRSVTETDSFSVASPGPTVFGVSNPGAPMGGTVFEMLETIAVAIETGDVDTMREGIEATDAALSRTQTEVGRLGGLSSRLTEIEERSQQTQLATQERISTVRDVDMGEAIVRMRTAETAYEATLSAASRSLSRSLLDFLR